MLPCHIVRDLLPSYLEHLTGPETEADICEHLESCPDCRAARDAMAADLKAEKAPPPKLNFLKRLRWQQRLGPYCPWRQCCCAWWDCIGWNTAMT